VSLERVLLHALIKLGRFGQRVEGGYGFDQTGDGEGVENAAGLADEMKDAAFAAQRDRHADEGGNSGTVNLRNTVEVNNDLAGAFLKHRSQCSGKLVAGIANGEASVNIKNPHACFFTYVDFNGSVLSHILCKGSAKQTLKPGKGSGARRHYTMRRGSAGK